MVTNGTEKNGQMATKNFIFTVVGTGIALGILVLSLLLPLREDLHAHETLPAHAGSQSMFTALTTDISDLRDDIRELRQDIKDLREVSSSSK